MEKKSKVAVIGAGPMGLMCAYELLKQGHDVSIFERDDRIGGMSASFDLDGTKIERYYHFICKTDFSLFDLLDELNIKNKLVWQKTSMGFYFDGKLYSWGSPFSLLKFPKLSFIEKIRYGLHVLYCKKIKNWSRLDSENAIQWLQKWLGKNAYRVLWHKLLELKFFEYHDQLSAAWIASRIQRVARSRKNIFTETLGFLQGGSDLLLTKIENQILAMGGKINLNAGVEQVVVEDDKATSLKVNGNLQNFDAILSTVPLPYVPHLVPDLSTEVKQKISAIKNVGVVCMILKLKQNYSRHFWTNINQDNIEIPGIIEYSNLNPESGNILYVPYYMPHSHQKNSYSDDDFKNEVIHYLKKMNPQFSEEWIMSSKVSRYAFAQTVCSPDFYKKLPAMKSGIKGFYMADTSYYYPEDRSISESVRIGKELATLYAGDSHG